MNNLNNEDEAIEEEFKREVIQETKEAIINLQFEKS